MRRRASAVCLLLAIAVLAGAQGAPAAPRAVERVEASTVRVDRAKLQAVAFAIDRRGGFLTTEQAASRGTDIKIVFPGGKALPATREDSDAPAGLAILRVKGAPRMRPLTFSKSGVAAGDQVWTVAPPPRLAGPQNARVKAPGYPFNTTEGILFLGQPGVPGLTGSPVVDSRGRVVAVLRPKRFPIRFQEAVIVSARPVALPAYRPPAKKDFPAVPVVIGLGILLLLANIWFTRRRRHDVADVLATVRTPAEAESHAPERAPLPADEDDDLVIELKRPAGKS